MINSDLLQNIQENIGLSPLQTQIIIELMKQGGQCTAIELYSLINDHMKANRTTIYSNLEKLRQENIIIESITENNSKIYGLVSSKPEDLIAVMKKPREMAFEKFENLLTEASEESKNRNLSSFTYYSLPNHKILLEYVQSLIETSKKYILIQGNSLFLNEIISFIRDKARNKDIKIFVQITWNPQGINSNDIYNEYLTFLDPECIALPHLFYNDLFSIISPTNEELIMLENKEIFVKYMTNIHFVQILTDEASLVGAHFGKKEGGGYLTRDPFTTQVFYIIFFLIFESSVGKHIDRSIIKGILRDRILSNLSAISKM